MAGVVVAALLLVLPAPSAGAAPRGDARGVSHVHETPVPPAGPGEKVVALTFDDGPHPTYTPPILDVLARYGVKATFFALGREAERHPDLVHRVVAEGHAIGNHTWDHKDLRPLTDEQFISQIDHTTEVLEGISGQRMICARPPYGKSDPRVTGRLAERGLTSVVWTADSRDFEKPGVGAIVDSALQGLQPGGIVLLHDGGGNRDQTIAALPTIIERILAAGYRIAPICQPDQHTPTGALTSVVGEKGGHLTAAGWGADPDAPGAMEVDLHLDGAPAGRVTANGAGDPGPTFTATLRARPGPHEVCATAINVGPGRGDTSLGCATTEVPALTPLDDLRELAAQLLFVQLQEEVQVLQRVAVVHDARRRPWRAE
jgi:peptidoglycan-N-acetylglucosamine deacetylase